MADADRIAAALRYQQELDAAQRPATMNPNIAAQGVKARANMTPPESVMDPRYPAWKKSQDDAEAFMTAADLVGSAIPLAGPAVKGAAALGRYAGPELARGLEQHMVRMGGIMPLDVYHGTPHRFPPTAKNPLGEFDASKIGTGEGAQAYGHGFYLAESPVVADQYARTITGAKIADSAGFQASRDRGATSSAIDYFRAMQEGKVPRDLDAVGKPVSDSHIVNQIDGLRKELSSIDASFGVSPNLYTVDLPDEQIAKMLDWDKPLSQQPELNNALKKFTDEYGLVEPLPTMTGKQYYQSLENYIAATSAEGLKRNVSQDVSGLLRQYGIPGIRYLDGGSRGAGQGTSNFVVFDPAHMNIIGRE